MIILFVFDCCDLTLGKCTQPQSASLHLRLMYLHSVMMDTLDPFCSMAFQKNIVQMQQQELNYITPIKFHLRVREVTVRGVPKGPFH